MSNQVGLCTVRNQLVLSSSVTNLTLTQTNSDHPLKLKLP